MQAAGQTDFHPSRMAVVSKHLETFIREFFDQNPLSHIGLVTIKDGLAYRLTDLGGSPDSHIKALFSKLECSGDSSLQNALDLVHEYLSQIPSYGHREVLVLYNALSTCDPDDIMETIQKCKKAKIRCSVIGLSAEIYICKHLCEETGGVYTVALSEVRLVFVTVDGITVAFRITLGVLLVKATIFLYQTPMWPMAFGLLHALYMGFYMISFIFLWVLSHRFCCQSNKFYLNDDDDHHHHDVGIS